MSSFVIIDEKGFPRSEETHLPRPIAIEVLNSLKFSETGALVSEVAGQVVFVEAFDEPFVAQSITAENNSDVWTLELPFHQQKKFSLTHLTVDEWDRFHGHTLEGLPFVLSAEAQDQVFNSVDEFDDDSLTFLKKKYLLHPWLSPSNEVESSQFWSNLYQKKEEIRWDLGTASPVFKDLLPRLKIPKARVLVLGSGPGHDAAFFAEHGHVVTAVDISPDAIALAKKNYPDLKNIHWHQADIFHLPQDWESQFDVVIEHTCYCAINPKLRNELVKTWLRLLAPQGHLLGTFFAMDKRNGPPFGGSEWEIRERLKKRFHFLFWGRWRQSIERRQGLELAEKKKKK